MEITTDIRLRTHNAFIDEQFRADEQFRVFVSVILPSKNTIAVKTIALELIISAARVPYESLILSFLSISQ
jgi:hypothetical protein